MSDGTTSTGSVKAGRREWLGLAVLAVPTLILSVDLSVLYIALPNLSADLGATALQQLWIVDIYGFLIAGLLVTMASVGDRIGRRRLLLIGAAAFTAASVWAAFSVNPTMLIAARAAMGIAGATMMPSTLSLITTMFQDPRERSVAVAAWMSSFMLGMVVGPVVGGVMLQNFWWGSVFLLAVPIMLVLLAAGPRILPEFALDSPGPIDVTSVLMSLAGILSLIYGAKSVTAAGWSNTAGVALAVGLLLTWLFVNRQRRLETPLIEVRLFANARFSYALGLMLLIAVFQGGSGLLVASWIQMVDGQSPLGTGLWLLPAVPPMILSLMLAPRLAQSIRPAYLIAGALMVAAVGYAFLSQIQPDSGPGALIGAYALVMLGMGIPAALGTALVMGTVQPEDAGSASSLSETVNELGVAMGVAFLGAVSTAVYRAQISGQLGSDVPGDAAAMAEGSMAEAREAASTVQDPDSLLTVAGQAFTSGLNLAAVICGVAFVVMSVVVVMTMRGIHLPSQEEMMDESA